MILLAFFACADPEPRAEVQRWPRPGETAVIEVNAAVGERGRATAWSAVAWTEAPEAAAEVVTGCRIQRARPPAVGLAAVDVTAPAAVRLVRDEAGVLRTSGPLGVGDARWSIGDVVLTRDDGVRIDLPGAIRFGDAPDVLAVRDGLGGDVALRWSRTADETLEVIALRRDGQTMVCSGGEGGLLAVPAYAFDPAHPAVRVRAVRETLTVAPNAALVRVRAAVELVISLADPAVSERALPRPRPGKPAWEPRRVLRVRQSWG